jgi:hypothetical protein
VGIALSVALTASSCRTSDSGTTVGAGTGGGTASGAPTSTAAASTADPTTSPSPSKVAAAGATGEGADGSTRTVPLTCQDVERAFVKEEVAYTSIVDDTKDTQKAAENGTLPYAIKLHCVVRLPGDRYDEHVQLDLAPSSSSKELVTTIAQAGDDPKRLPPEQGFSDVAYLFHPLPSQFAVLAGRHAWVLSVGKLRSGADAKNVVRELLGKL